MTPLRLLFVCSRNQWRSPTAERLLASRPDVKARSAGTEPSARVRVNAGHLQWADRVFCMERRHVERLRERFPDLVADKAIVCLDIPDDFRFLDPALVELLTTALAEYLPAPDAADDRSERNLGTQPIAGILAALALKPADLVASSPEHLTHKMVTRACKGRWLTPNAQGKVCRALNTASGRTYALAELFNYR